MMRSESTLNSGGPFISPSATFIRRSFDSLPRLLTTLFRFERTTESNIRRMTNNSRRCHLFGACMLQPPERYGSRATRWLKEIYRFASKARDRTSKLNTKLTSPQCKVISYPMRWQRASIFSMYYVLATYGKPTIKKSLFVNWRQSLRYQR